MCERYQYGSFIEEWRTSRHWVCPGQVESFPIKTFNINRSFCVFYNVTMNSIDGNIYAPCPYLKNRRQKWNREWNGQEPTRVVQTIYRVCRSDVYNPFQAFGAYLNAFVAFRLFNLTRDTHIVITDLHGDRHNFDSDIWSSLSAHPIVYRDSVSRRKDAPLLVVAS